MESLTRESLAGNYTHIRGWGADIDAENEPTYPMKKYTGDDHQRLHYKRPPNQNSNVEILQSNERPNITAVYGTSAPPSGLSGKIRRIAFRYSEGSFGHWIPLLIADRINVIEGIIEDVRNGTVPNIFAERGWKAGWKYNRAGLVKKLVITTAIATGIVLMLSRKKKGS